jgi:hypothetical protein
MVADCDATADNTVYAVHFAYPNCDLRSQLHIHRKRYTKLPAFIQIGRYESMTKPHTIATGSISPCWLATIKPRAYGLFKNAIHDACVEWLQNDWPRAANEEAMTPKLLTQISVYVKRAAPQIQKELKAPPFHGSFYFDYVEATKSQEHQLGADFAILVELNLPNCICAERFSLFQAKLFDHNSTTIKKEQLEVLRNFTEESYYIFYNDKVQGPIVIPYVLRARNIEAILAGRKNKTTLFRQAVVPFALDFDTVLVDHIISLWEGEDHIKSLHKVVPIIRHLVPRLITIRIASERGAYYENQ